MTLVILLVLLVTLLTVPQTFAKDNSRYLCLVSTDKISYYFDTQTLELTSRNVNGTNCVFIDVWLKLDYNQAGVQQEIQFRKDSQLPVVGYDQLAFSLHHWVYMITADGVMRGSSRGYVDYAKDGSVLDDFTTAPNDYSNTSDIVAGSAAESILVKLAEYVKGNNLHPQPTN